MTQTRMTGGEAVVETLIANGVDTIFGLPGAQLDPIFAALHDRQDRISMVHGRHEQGPAYMAFGYAASTGKPGVSFTVPGPGFFNAGAGMVTAYAMNAPCLYFSGQLRLPAINKGFGALHEIPNQFEMGRNITKWASKITHADEAPRVMQSALTEIFRGRPRPVYVEGGIDVLNTVSNVPNPADFIFEKPKANEPDAGLIDEAAKMLAEAKCPQIFVGGGAIGAGAEIAQLAETLNAPITPSIHGGYGVVDSRHPNMFSQVGAHHWWQHADVILAIGTRLSPAIPAWGFNPKEMKIIRIDIDPEELVRHSIPQHHIHSDSNDAVAAINAVIERYMNGPAPDRSDLFASIRNEVAKEVDLVKPQKEITDVIRSELGEDGILVSDLTQCYYASHDNFPTYKPRTYIHPGYQGTLGHCVATSLGVKVGNPDVPVVALCGDGGFMFTITELATAAKYQIGVIFLVVNDNTYGNVKRIMNANYGGRVFCADLVNPNYQKLADAFGMESAQVNNPADLQKEMKRLINKGGPAIIEYQAGEFPNPWHLYHRKKVR